MAISYESDLVLIRHCCSILCTKPIKNFFQNKKFSHLADTIAQYYSDATPLWWIEFKKKPVGCLWMGSGIDQVTGQRYGHIFLVYILLEHRRKGLATTLMSQAEIWAKSQGNFQLGLQVFLDNQPAVNFYQNFGFQTQSLLMVKPL